MLNKIVAWLACFSALALLPATTAQAHPSPSSQVLLDFEAEQVTAQLSLPLEQLELAFKHPLAAAPQTVLPLHRQALEAYVAAHLRPVTPDGQPWLVKVTAMRVALEQTPVDLIVTVRMLPPPTAPLREFTLGMDVISHEVQNHITLVAVRKDWRAGVLAREPEVLGTLHFGVHALSVNRAGGGWWRGIASLFQLGVNHIIEGSDHLLFLLTLLLPAPLLAPLVKPLLKPLVKPPVKPPPPTPGRSTTLARGKDWGGFAGVMPTIRQLLRVVTAFTLGHSLTLIAGAAGWVRLPSQSIEILIAVSILVSAMHAWRPLFSGKEMWLAGGFGLLHGLAFAAALAELQLDGWQMAAGILAFNLGIEAVQLAIVLASLPCLLLLSQLPLYRPVRRGAALLAGLAALAWIAERAFFIQNPLNDALAALIPHAPWLLLAVTVLAYVLQRRARKFRRAGAPRMRAAR